MFWQIQNKKFSPTDIVKLISSLQALLRKAFRSPGVLVLGDSGIFGLFLPRAKRAVKISRIHRKCLICLPKLGSPDIGKNNKQPSSARVWSPYHYNLYHGMCLCVPHGTRKKLSHSIGLMK